MRLLLLLLLITLSASACGTEVGDTCATNVECATLPGAICDISIPGGYCTLADCRPNTCPVRAICVQFDEVSSYCMRHCEDSDDCRDGQVCRRDLHPMGFCYAPASSASTPAAP